ncbi:unnamed protein product [Strongylus vulgaris]|uniref:Uncharacterized protein n=1 Tax=Strongylus vulgaris TaxID=40348 RepID=A0A3P7JAU0_STRVU|nr:unnamed protein product [Strongylus vulgaris]
MREAEAVGEHSNHSRISSDPAPKTSEINLDEVFCVNKGRSSKSKECGCNACNLTKLSDEERAKLTKAQPLPIRRQRTEERTPKRSFSSNCTPAVDISLEDVFNPRRTSPIRIVRMSTEEEPIFPLSKSAEPAKVPVRDAGSPKPFRHSILTKEARSASVPIQQISLDWVAALVGEPAKVPVRDAGSPKPFRHSILTKEVRSASVPIQQISLDWVAALVGGESGPNQAEKAESHSPERISNNLKHNHLEHRTNSDSTITKLRSSTTKELQSNGHKDGGMNGWLNSLVNSKQPEEQPTVLKEQPKELKDEKIQQKASRELGKIENHTVSSAPELTDDLIYKVFNRVADSKFKDAKKCKCAACETETSSTPIPAERKRRFAKKEEVSI